MTDCVCPIVQAYVQGFDRDDGWNATPPSRAHDTSSDVIDDHVPNG